MLSSAPVPEVSEPQVQVGEGGQRFRVEGMDCASCARTVEKAVAALEGTHDVRVSFGNALLVVEGPVAAERVERAVASAGYRVRPAARRRPASSTPFWRSSAQALSTSISTLILAVAADMGMSLLVTLNGLRLLRRRAIPAVHHEDP